MDGRLPKAVALRRPPAEVAELLAGVRLSEDPARELELATRLPSPSEPRAVSVTDLLSGRQAFWRRTRGPAPLAPERELRLDRGRAWHRRLGPAMAGDGRLEVHLRRGGISARIDLLADVPVEVKTSVSPAGGPPPPDRPEQLEQLAAYCALTGQNVGRLVQLAVPDDGPAQVSVTDLTFRDLGRIDRELERRESALRAALEAGSPEKLGRCRWFGLGCDYRASGMCDCRGDEPPEPNDLVGSLGPRAVRADVAARWAEALREAPPPGPAPVDRFRDLLYPRRTYFDRTLGVPPPDVRPRGGPTPADTYERTVAALERGPVGDVHAVPPGAGGPDEEVLAWRGAPVLVRSSRQRARLTAEAIRTRFPQYLLDLGFRCAVTGTPGATLVMGREFAAPGEPPVEVFTVDLAGGTGRFAALWNWRREELERAVAERTPLELPGCPAWMATDCPYRETCGCAGDAGRSQR